jgi:hypothetical protein
MSELQNAAETKSRTAIERAPNLTAIGDYGTSRTAPRAALVAKAA